MSWNEMSPADLSAVMGNRNGNGWGGNGMFGDGAWWIIILFLFAMNGNWGGNRGGNGGAADYIPLMMAQNGGCNCNGVQQGFDQAAIINGINGVNAAVVGAQAAAANSFAQAEIAASNRQLAEMQQNFALQQGLQQCCCDNRAGLADLKYTVATENCADRNALSQEAAAMRAEYRNGQQMIMDKLCALELDGVKQQLDSARTEITNLRFEKSQTAQDGFVQRAINEAVARVNPAPIPAYPVQNPNCCNQGYSWNNCGCGYNR